MKGGASASSGAVLARLFLLFAIFSVVLSFEAAEHKHIGDSAFFALSSEIRSLCPAFFEEEFMRRPVPEKMGYEVDGVPMLKFRKSGVTATYGDIVALAGDFLAKEAPISLTKAEERSDAIKEQYQELTHGVGDDTMQALVSKLQHIFQEEIESLAEYKQDMEKCLEKEDQGFMCRVFGHCDDEYKEECYHEYRPKAFYDDGGIGDLVEMEFKSDFRLLANALKNYDHFGGYAVRAYEAIHAEALRMAARVSQAKTSEDKCEVLREALAVNAFSEHYLSDLFSAGHIRTPRLHLEVACSTSMNMNPISFLGLGHVVGSAPTKAMHDEDSANGLNVANGRGDRWQCFGDKMYFDDKNAKNKEQVNKAVVESLREVIEAAKGTYGSEGKRDISDFGALPYIPVLHNSNGPEDAFAMSNPYPMFFLLNGMVYTRFSEDRPYGDLDDGVLPSVNPYALKYQMDSCNPLDGADKAKLRKTPTEEVTKERRREFEEAFLIGKKGVPSIETHQFLDFLSARPLVAKRNLGVSVKTCEKSSTWWRDLRVSVRFFNKDAKEHENHVLDPVNTGHGSKNDMVFSQTSWISIHHPKAFREGKTDSFQNLQASNIGGKITDCEVMLTDKTSWLPLKWCPEAMSVTIPYKHGFKRFICDFGCECLKKENGVLRTSASEDGVKASRKDEDSDIHAYEEVDDVPLDFGPGSSTQKEEGSTDAPAGKAEHAGEDDNETTPKEASSTLRAKPKPTKASHDDEEARAVSTEAKESSQNEEVDSEGDDDPDGENS